MESKRLFCGLTRSTLAAIVVVGVLMSLSVWQAAAKKQQKNGIVYRDGKFDLSQWGPRRSAPASGNNSSHPFAKGCP